MVHNGLEPVHGKGWASPGRVIAATDSGSLASFAAAALRTTTSADGGRGGPRGGVVRFQAMRRGGLQSTAAAARLFARRLAPRGRSGSSLLSCQCCHGTNGNAVLRARE